STMLDRAIQAGVSASYVLMDSWFTHAPLIQEVTRRGLQVIGMVKNDNKRYLVSHTTIVFSRYILLAWQHRQSTDQRSLGGLFYLLCDEVGIIDWAVALQQMVDLITDIATKAGKRITSLIQRQLQQWIGGLPSYIKAYLSISCCES
ncbi:transposase, partial [Paenibacillus profundus]